MQSPVPHDEQPITQHKELEARIQALEAMVGALLRFSAGQQDLASAMKEARQRGEAFMRDPANNVPTDCLEFYRDSFHTLAVSMIPLQELETFRTTLQGMSAEGERGGEESSRGCSPF